MSDEQKAPLAIENTAANPDKAANVLEVDGQAIKLDSMGPMIVNADGTGRERSSPQTISRITNWQELSDIEKERTVRLLVKKRNLVRMKKLEADAPEGEERVTALQS
ncbi:hypothetical protein A1Q2_07654 [Trichosporon asahii var. asahii CBS 8904]|uniref:Uncharacterized protein n=2 Tax=Trichosporon asahii var. asahii TaxID=189963 RepID=K1W932_TRIAC|nr:hypothetical protein A1Q1_01583 [Trichosporon asahii var. asahii CBS 2479]EJT49283.1 hypothetical protein A1Q1_01583 [Trichosporon asahii var. asahii CBS 2479]EKC98108.1 hypothetical protein A1Q2_07654 [Trichosporon asahii var. asahii CBS 8904]